MENKDLDIDLAERLKQLGITGWVLARMMATQDGAGTDRKTLRNYYSSIKRAIDNPESISIGLYKAIIFHVGGQLHHTWDENIFSEPEGEVIDNN